MSTASGSPPSLARRSKSTVRSLPSLSTAPHSHSLPLCRPVVRRTDRDLRRVRRRRHQLGYPRRRRCLPRVPHHDRPRARQAAAQVVRPHGRQRRRHRRPHHLGERQAARRRQGRDHLRRQLLRVVQRGGAAFLRRHYPGHRPGEPCLDCQGARWRLWADHTVRSAWRVRGERY